MPTTAGFAPWMGSVILTTATTKYQLSALIAAIEKNLPTRWTLCIIEMDITLSAGNVYIGGPNVSSVNCGRHLVPSNFQNIAAYDTGVILSTDIYLTGDTNAQQINITALPIGM